VKSFTIFGITSSKFFVKSFTIFSEKEKREEFPLFNYIYLFIICPSQCLPIDLHCRSNQWLQFL
jgi:hypothetical protein